VAARPGAGVVAGVDSSTQSCKVVVRELGSGRTMRRGRAPHPPGTELDPEAWWFALGRALDDAGGLDDVAAVSVAAQQHGMVCLDEDGRVVRPALLWNDIRAAPQAAELRAELGAAAWAEAVGSVPLASFTVAKLRWLAATEPESARRVAAVCLPHDWLTWRLCGATGLDVLTTDRGDASGTGYWSPAEGRWRDDLLELAFGRRLRVPRVLGPAEPAGATPGGTLVGAGTGDNMAAALGLGAAPGDVVVSIGTSGVVSAVSPTPSADPSGAVAGFADATGSYLPLVCTLNAATVLDTTARLLAVDAAAFAHLANSAPPGSGGLVFVPYLDGERTPDLPRAAGTLAGVRHANLTPGCLARAAVEGVLCSLAGAVSALAERGGVRVDGRLLLVGGGAASDAVRRVAPTVFGQPVSVPAPAEYVAEGACRQAAWALTGEGDPPMPPVVDVEGYAAPFEPRLVERFAEFAARAASNEAPGGI
jgi:xylulokinase